MLFYFASSLVIISACNSGVKNIFIKKSAREKYEDKVENLYPAEGKSWKNAGALALVNNLMIPAPYSETGSLYGDSADAVSFRFPVSAGQIIQVNLVKLNSTFTAYTELWEVSIDGSPRLVAAADTLSGRIEHPSLQAAEYIVRMQPELKSRGDYKLSILLSPLLGSPIQQGVKNNIGSVWGDTRDAGARSHEGIDIFTKKGAYVVAVTDGTVRQVSDGGIGGKVVWLSPADYNFSVYYAHLDTQLVQSGQRVKKGDVLGTVGNTGNARFTPAHLHFGVYTGYGAVDPLAFVQDVKEPRDVIAPKRLNQRYKMSAKTKLFHSPDKKNPLLLNEQINFKTQSFSGLFYRVILENGLRGFIAESDITNKMTL